MTLPGTVLDSDCITCMFYVTFHVHVCQLPLLKKFYTYTYMYINKTFYTLYSIILKSYWFEMNLLVAFFFLADAPALAMHGIDLFFGQSGVVSRNVFSELFSVCLF